MTAMQPKSLDLDAVRRAYRRWAPVYDQTFGRIAAIGRRAAVAHINKRTGRVLEVGVGTGLSLPAYAPHLEIAGIDISPEMLAKAKARLLRANNGRAKPRAHITGLARMDAGALGFADDAFDTVVAMYVMTVVPDPVAVMRELARVCTPGGEVILVNHFSQDQGLRGRIERGMAPYAETLGWHPLFPVERVMVCDNLRLISRRSLWPLGVFSMLVFRKEGGDAASHSPADTPTS